MDSVHQEADFEIYASRYGKPVKFTKGRVDMITMWQIFDQLCSTMKNNGKWLEGVYCLKSIGQQLEASIDIHVIIDALECGAFDYIGRIWLVSRFWLVKTNLTSLLVEWSSAPSFHKPVETSLKQSVLDLGRLTDTDIAIFKKIETETDLENLEQPKNTDYLKIKADIAICFRFSPCIQPVFFHNLSDTCT